MDSASESILVRVAFVAEQVRDVEDEVIRRNNEHIQCQERKTRRWIDILAKKWRTGVWRRLCVRVLNLRTTG